MMNMSKEEKYVVGCVTSVLEGIRMVNRAVELSGVGAWRAAKEALEKATDHLKNAEKVCGLDLGLHLNDIKDLIDKIEHVEYLEDAKINEKVPYHIEADKKAKEVFKKLFELAMELPGNISVLTFKQKMKLPKEYRSI